MQKITDSLFYKLSNNILKLIFILSFVSSPHLKIHLPVLMMGHTVIIVIVVK